MKMKTSFNERKLIEVLRVINNGSDKLEVTAD